MGKKIITPGASRQEWEELIKEALEKGFIYPDELIAIVIEQMLNVPRYRDHPDAKLAFSLLCEKDEIYKRWKT